ncbi:MAG TPA: NAD(P)-dependent oxidoreductase [Gemmatimonadaceae bacterium]|nr:NAD(P)-dependent oxidoreductase [Gemmatimonadaceae bacterium]
MSTRLRDAQVASGTSLRILITGATGVVGRRVVPQLVAIGHRVTAVGRTPEKRDALAAAGATPVALDLFDAGAVRRALDGHDVAINLATHIPPSAGRMMLRWEWRENDRLRRDASAILAAAATTAGVGRFIQESFAPIYDDYGAQWIEESGRQRPAPFNRTVLDAERSAQRFTESGGTGVVLRFAGFYGPDAFLHDMANVVRRGWSPLPGAAKSYWSSVSHDDAATAVIAALGVAAGAYNVCDDEPLTRRAWTDALATAVGAPPPKLMPAWLLKLGGAAVEVLSRSQRMSHVKLTAASGWRPRWRSAREGLQEAVRQLEMGGATLEHPRRTA